VQKTIGNLRWTGRSRFDPADRAASGQIKTVAYARRAGLPARSRNATPMMESASFRRWPRRPTLGYTDRSHACLPCGRCDGRGRVDNNRRQAMKLLRIALLSFAMGGGTITVWRHQLSVYILVVDDEPDVEALFRQQFRRDLKSGRFTMEFAPSAPDALLRAAEIRDPSLILILSDINMPGMSGLEMLPKVRAERPDVPVIMITAYGDAETRRKAIERGAVGLLTKPIDFALLRHEIDTRLGQAA
jgi:CheY-like chemotaxis protein